MNMDIGILTLGIVFIILSIFSIGMNTNENTSHTIFSVVLLVVGIVLVMSAIFALLTGNSIIKE